MIAGAAALGAGYFIISRKNSWSVSRKLSNEEVRDRVKGLPLKPRPYRSDRSRHGDFVPKMSLAQRVRRSAGIRPGSVRPKWGFGKFHLRQPGVVF